MKTLKFIIIPACIHRRVDHAGEPGVNPSLTIAALAEYAMSRSEPTRKKIMRIFRNERIDRKEFHVSVYFCI